VFRETAGCDLRNLLLAETCGIPTI
jgi:hypothetical protein